MGVSSKKISINSGKYESLLLGCTGDKSLIDYFIGKNAQNFKEPMFLNVEGEQYSFEYFLGISENSDEDLVMVFDAYKGRIPDGYVAVAVVNEVDFICAGPGARFYLWRRDVNDLYFESGGRNAYKKQDENLYVLAQNFTELLGLIEGGQEAEDDEEFEDDFENPQLPFDDADIQDEFKYPELFFKQPAKDVSIQLRKLKLSKKGLELLALFRERGLL